MTVHIFSPPIETMTVGEHCAIITTYCDEGLGPWLGLVWRGGAGHPPMQMRWSAVGHAPSPWLNCDIHTKRLTKPEEQP